MADGQTVDFSLSGATGGGEVLVPTSAVTLSGLVSTTLNSGTRAGTVKIVASIGDTIFSKPVAVTIHGGPPDANHFSLAVAKMNVTGLIHSGIVDTIYAYVFDEFSNPVPEGTSIYFETTGGGVLGSAKTDAYGTAWTLLITADPRPADGLVIVTGTTIDKDGNLIQANAYVLLTGMTIIISDLPNFAVPDAGSADLTFHVSDFNGNPLSKGTTITVKSSSGQLVGDTEVTLPDTMIGYTDFKVTLIDDDVSDGDPPIAASITIEVISPNGDQKLTVSGTID